jgi:alpha-D-ribose 1-methylphosphonate 5-phosphate C-P lyase
MDELPDENNRQAFYCSDTAYCDAMHEARERGDRDALERLQGLAR